MVLKKYFGDKAFYRMILTIAVPIMIQNGITNFVSLLDNIMVGNLGTEAMSGVSIVNQFVFIFNLLIFGAVSPDFLLNPLKNLLDINLIIASPCNKSSGIFYGKNCYGKEKVSRFKTECPEINIEAFYSDSVSDKPMKDISGQSFLVYGDKIVPWNSD